MLPSRPASRPPFSINVVVLKTGDQAVTRS
jgi:hypothetical protein